MIASCNGSYPEGALKEAILIAAMNDFMEQMSRCASEEAVNAETKRQTSKIYLDIKWNIKWASSDSEIRQLSNRLDRDCFKRGVTLGFCSRSERSRIIADHQSLPSAGELASCPPQ
jgi:hypothetical protein